MSIFSGTSQIKVLMIGRDNITRKFMVNYDAQYFQDKYRIDPDAIVLTLEPGLLGFGGKSVPTIIFRENSIEPVSKKHPGTIPSPEEFGENVNRLGNAIAILRAKKKDEFEQSVYILLIISIIVGCGAVYFGYHDGQMIADSENSISAIGTQISTMHSALQSQITMFNTTSGNYEQGGVAV